MSARFAVGKLENTLETQYGRDSNTPDARSGLLGDSLASFGLPTSVKCPEGPQLWVKTV